MNPKKQSDEEPREWVEKSRSDLMAARVLKEHGAPVRGAACFHCQQTVEKVLKAFLIYNRVDFEKVHNLEYLLDLCVEKDGSFEELRNAAELMAPFAVDIRYPGYMEISKGQMEKALSSAERIYSFVTGKLPKSVYPPDTNDMKS